MFGKMIAGKTHTEVNYAAGGPGSQGRSVSRIHHEYVISGTLLSQCFPKPGHLPKGRCDFNATNAMVVRDHRAPDLHLYPRGLCPWRRASCLQGPLSAGAGLPGGLSSPAPSMWVPVLTPLVQPPRTSLSTGSKTSRVHFIFLPWAWECSGDKILSVVYFFFGV